MQTYPVRSLSDARNIIRAYQLDQLDWEGSGTANGFANYLFVPGMEMTVGQIAHELDSYKARFRMAAAAGEDFDAKLEEDAENLSASLEDCADQRASLAAAVQDIKYGPDGGVLWNAIASIATSVQHKKAFNELGKKGLLPRLMEVLAQLREFEEECSDSLDLEYEPGLDKHMDFLVRQDILRLDDTMLHAQPWAGDDPDWFQEIGALLRLACDDDVRALLEQAVEGA